MSEPSRRRQRRTCSPFPLLPSVQNCSGMDHFIIDSYVTRNLPAFSPLVRLPSNWTTFICMLYIGNRKYRLPMSGYVNIIGSLPRSNQATE